MDIRSILADHGFQAATNASVSTDMTQVNQALSDLSAYVDGAFMDGIVTQIEAAKIEAYVNNLNDTNNKIQQEYEALYNNSGLTDETVKSALAEAKATYDTGYYKLINDIENAIADGVATKDEGDLVDSDYLAMTTDSSNLQKAMETARDSILGKRVSDAQQASQDYADQLKQGIDSTTDSLQQQLTDTNGYIDGSFKDGIIDQSESSKIQAYLNTLSLQKSQLDNRYNQVYNNYFLADGTVEKANLLDAKTQYDTKYQSLVDTINNAIADGVATAAEKSVIDQGFIDLGDALSLLTTCLEKAVDKLSQARADSAESLAISGANDYTDRQVGVVTTIIDDMASDDKIVQSERLTIKDDVTRIVGYVLADTEHMPDLATIDASQKGEVYAARQEALNSGLTETAVDYTNIGDAYTALANYMDAMTPLPWDTISTDTITVDKGVWRNTWLDYYDSIAEVKATISKTLKDNADSRVDASTYTTDMQNVNQQITDVSNKVTISCYIQSTNGSVFKNGELSTTLNAIVRQGPDDITATIASSRFVWKRVSADTVGDQTWNQAHVNAGSSITVTSDDVKVRATFECDILDVV